MRTPEYPEELVPDARVAVLGAFSVYAGYDSAISNDRAGDATWSEVLADYAVAAIHNDARMKRIKNRLRSLDRDTVPEAFVPALDSLVQLNNPNELLRIQERQYALAAKKLEKLKRKIARKNIDEGLRGHYIGQRNELVTLMLLTRYKHPWLFAFPALPHHENDEDRQAHYDVALGTLEGVFTDEPHYRGYKLQVKTMCSGMCGGEPTENKSAEYDDSVQIVSACCNLKGDGRSSAYTSALLLSEYKGRLKESGIAQLDVVTDRLLFDITADLLPRGELAVAA